MSAIAFDTLEFTKRLVQAGASREIAEATAEAFKKASGEAELATKGDIRDLRNDFDRRFELLQNELKLHRWILAIIAAGVVLPIIQGMIQ
uniref:DUF1640 domain-containing protein n=1 Tax=Candidatus Kentrum eta TaxID=2126337 RepID=A0A450UQC4_9GAMM|nr:MAG: hypothetical protein BECKH772A_GA0070896_1000849 [Candidatus Kentron sp. H]VFJ92791.1 MAG: hypothetical protein BECKH772B_GA0070898_100342 [Candidatus Kentron sp. H]VFJ94758.1 MAG: hypothetical protein BECKH772C_GA0070978_100011 [Candidatus Kentron sp. H]